MKPALPDLPVTHYFPFADGLYSTAARLKKISTDFGNGAADQKIFQIDRQWQDYRNNKEACRQEDISKYWKTKRLRNESRIRISEYIIQQLLSDYPQFFSLQKQAGNSILTNQLSQESLSYDLDYQLLGAATTSYPSFLDALACQLQEDLAIWEWDGKRDWMSMIHLCAPNHWSPADKIGQPFSEVHLPVAGMEKMRARYQPMLKGLLKGGKFVRFAWGLSTDNRLNHHPEPPKGADSADWAGRQFDPYAPSLYLRVERQTLSGFPVERAVLFTIRTYFEEVSTLSKDHLQALIQAIDSMSTESLHYKGLKEDKPAIQNYIQSCVQKYQG